MKLPQEEPNPYQAPAELPAAGPVSSAATVPSVLVPPNIRGIAVAQRGVVLCVLFHVAFILLFAFQLAQKEELPTVVSGFLVILASVFGVGGLVYSVQLAVRTYGTFFGIILGSLAMVPVLGAIALIAIDMKATRILNDYGVRVGVFGVKHMPSAVDD